MVRPTPITEAPSTAPAEPPPKIDAEHLESLSDPLDRARAFLELLGRSSHPDAAEDPVYALYQVAVDFRCSAYGYRDLYLHLQRGI